MSTLTFHVPTVPQPIIRLRRVFSVIAMMMEAFAEAQQQAIAAHKRYPFADL